MLSNNQQYKIFNAFVILDLLQSMQIYYLLLISLPKTFQVMLNLLLKTQHFAISLSVTVSEAKNFSSPFLRMMIKPGKSRKGEKPTSENRRKINGLKASKIDMNGIFFIQKFFSLAIEISRQYCASSNYIFFTQNIKPLGVPTTSRKRSRGPMNVLNSG